MVYSTYHYIRNGSVHMSKILLHNQFRPETTTVSNFFIDRYMPAANGTFVKVYLFLLRHLSEDSELSISKIADDLDETEKDINRALNYWEQQQLIALFRDDTNQITDISILDMKERSSAGVRGNEPNEVTAAPIITDTTVKESEHIHKAASHEKKELHKPNYSDAQISVLTDIDEVKWMMSALEQYLERLLKPGDVQLVLYLYESLGFSAELILYLYEYCVSKNKKSASYVETVALSWAEEGIDSIEKAEAANQTYNSSYQTVNKAFGLNRAPGNIEKQFILRWYQTYGFDSAIIEEACSRTILTTGKPDFKYADKILENWHKKNVKQFSDIKKIDDEHQKRSQNAGKNTTSAQSTGGTPTSNKFNAFPQRQYTKDYYESMEKRLLNKER